MNDITLVEHEYKIYLPDPLVHQGADKAFQKCVKDDKGKKYFMEVLKYTFPYGLRSEIPEPNDQYSISTILYKAGTGNIESEMEIKFYSDDLEYVEKRIEKLWEFTGKGYYEKY